MALAFQAEMVPDGSVWYNAGLSVSGSKPKGADSTTLCILLLQPSDVAGDVLDGDGVLDGESVALALDPRAVDEHACVRLQPRACQSDVGVQARDLAHGPAEIFLGRIWVRRRPGSRDLVDGREGEVPTDRPGVLELGGGLLLDAEDDGVDAADADSGVALADGLESVLHLEEVSIGGEDSDGAVIVGHRAGITGG